MSVRLRFPVDDPVGLLSNSEAPLNATEQMDSNSTFWLSPSDGNGTAWSPLSELFSHSNPYATVSTVALILGIPVEILAFKVVSGMHRAAPPLRMFTPMFMTAITVNCLYAVAQLLSIHTTFSYASMVFFVPHSFERWFTNTPIASFAHLTHSFFGAFVHTLNVALIHYRYHLAHSFKPNPSNLPRNVTLAASYAIALVLAGGLAEVLSNVSKKDVFEEVSEMYGLDSEFQISAMHTNHPATWLFLFVIAFGSFTSFWIITASIHCTNIIVRRDTPPGRTYRLQQRFTLYTVYQLANTTILGLLPMLPPWIFGFLEKPLYWDGWMMGAAFIPLTNGLLSIFTIAQYRRRAHDMLRRWMRCGRADEKIYQMTSIRSLASPDVHGGNI